MRDNPIEPSAAQRQAAKELRAMHLALIEEGFTETEALKIIGYVIAGLRPQ